MTASLWVAPLKTRVDQRLQAFFEEKGFEAKERSPQGVLLVDQVKALTLRGGKRLRPMVAAAGCVATSNRAVGDAIYDLGAALELLQSYLLIHDDWMDKDLKRRGGPAVHAAFRASQPTDHEGDSLGILAGDLAGTFAWELFLGTAFPEERRAEAFRYFTSLQVDVIYGQHLDIIGHPDIERMHRLKTSAYTVEGPLHLGALLADAQEEQLHALERIGRPLGQAFQVRDDLLGTFGDPKLTGKPAGSDIRSGKENALIATAKARLQGAERATLERILGKQDATEQEVSEVVELLQARGVQELLENRLRELIDTAVAEVEQSPLTQEGAHMLRDLAGLLVLRDQ